MEDPQQHEAGPPRPVADPEGAEPKRAPPPAEPTWAPPSGQTSPPPAEPMFDLIEMFFFAYRDFVGDADRLLLRYNFGRAHHRVLHFVDRRPGLAVAELLDLLKITKQSLSRVLKDLLDQNYLEQRPGVADRRQRLLYATEKGHKLALELAVLQSRRFSGALASLPAGARDQAAAFLAAMRDSGAEPPADAPSEPGLVERGHAEPGLTAPTLPDPAP